MDDVTEARSSGAGSHIGAGPDEAVDISKASEKDASSAAGSTGHQQY